MYAITVKQPWAWAIAAGFKDVENRTTNWSYRGPLAIHAGRHWSRRGEGSTLIETAWRARIAASIPVAAGQPEFVTGAIIAVVDLADIHPAADYQSSRTCCEPWGEARYRSADHSLRTDVVHLVLRDARRITPPIDCPGALGLWAPPPEVQDLLAAP